MGCMNIGRGIQIPVFAKYCSKICYYDGDEARQAEISFCPLEGTPNEEVDKAYQKEYNRKNPTTTTTTERIIENPDMTIGLSTLKEPGTGDNELEGRNRVFGLRPVAFGRFDRPQRNKTSVQSNLFRTSNRSPRRQSTQQFRNLGLEKSIHQLVQEGFFDSPNNFAPVQSKSAQDSFISKTTERSSILQQSTISEFTTTSSLAIIRTSVKVVENKDRNLSSAEQNVVNRNKDFSNQIENNNKNSPIADASLLLNDDEPIHMTTASSNDDEPGSADWSLKTSR